MFAVMLGALPVVAYVIMVASIQSDLLIQIEKQRED